MSEERSEMVELTGLWLGKTKDGQSFMSGMLGGARVLIFKNTRKQAEKEPDYRLYIAKSERRQERKAQVEIDEWA